MKRLATAFDALASCGIILQRLSFPFPAALLLYRRRSEEFLPRTTHFGMNLVLGWTADIIVVIAAIVWTMFFEFLVVLPVTCANMSPSCLPLSVRNIWPT